MTATAQQTERRVELRQEERNLVKRRPNKTGYIARVEFRGPRGRKYIATRSAVQINREFAEREAQKIRGGNYKHGAFPTKTEILSVDFIGRVTAVETI